jgi:HEAT repeat protein
LVALEKIRDPSAGPSLVFLLNDLNEKVQLTAIEATGLLGNREAINDLRRLLDRSHNKDVKRAALTALAQMPDEELHGVYAAYIANKDDGLREAAAEGFARLRNPSDLASAQNAFANENKTGPRLAQAFALVSLGKRGMAEFDPLRYLVNNLNSALYRDTTRPYLIELARDPQVREALYPALRDPVVTKDEKTGLAQVLAASGDSASLAPLEALAKDPDPEVSKEAFRALQSIRGRP